MSKKIVLSLKAIILIVLLLLSADSSAYFLYSHIPITGGQQEGVELATETPQSIEIAPSMTTPPPPIETPTVVPEQPITVPSELPTIPPTTGPVFPTATLEPTQVPSSSPVVEPSQSLQANELVWSVEMEVTTEAQQLSALGGVESVKNQLKNDLSGLMSDKSIVTDVIKKVDGSGNSSYGLSLKGRGALAQLKTALYSDLKDKSPLLGGGVTISVEGNVQAGETLPYILDSNLSTGYIWEVQDAQGNLYPLENQQAILNTANGIGASQKQSLKIGASASGQGKLILVYHRPWEKDTTATTKISIQAAKLSDVLDLSNPVQVQTTSAILPEGSTSGASALAGSLVGLPTTYDWRSQGVNIPVRNQGGCGSCWAFSTVGAMEGALARAGVASPDLSEQYLVSCNNSGWSCNGGWFAHDYHVNNYISPQTVAGAVLESDFPYTATNGSCSRSYNHPYRLNSWNYVSSSYGMPSVDAIKNAIYTYGPISVGVCVGSSFQAYRSGVFATNDTSSCGGSINHAVVLTGWDDSTQSWSMRNSWGSSWGESGYMRIRYGYSNIGYSASYVVYGGVTPTRTPTSGPTATAGPTSTPSPTPTNTPTIVPSGNDDFDQASLVSSEPYANTMDTSTATTSSDDPTPSCGGGRKYNSVWYKYTPASDVSLQADTQSSNYDTVLSVYTGSRGALTGVACNDDYGSAYQSTVMFNAVPGQTYYMMVSSYYAGGGSLQFNLQETQIDPTPTPSPSPVPSGNDDFDGATTADPLPYTNTQDTTLASAGSDDSTPTCGGGSQNNSVWYSITPTENLPLRVNTLGSDYDTVLSVYSGERGSLQEIICNDDAPGALQSSVAFDAVSGVNYHVMISSYSAGGGNLTINLRRGLTTPSLVSPINSTTVSTNRPSFMWSAVSGATQYYLYVANASNVAYAYQWFTAASANCVGGTGQCSATSPRTLPGGSLTWKVRAGNADETGTYSTMGTFKVPTPPAAAILVSPINLQVVNTTKPIYTWNAVSNATRYYLIIRGIRGTVTSQWFSKEQTNCASGLGRCSVIPTQTLTKNSIYTWQIQTANTSGSGPLSRIGTFRISGTAKPNAPRAISSTIQKNLAATQAFTWQAVPNVNSYVVLITGQTGGVVAQMIVTPIQANCPLGSGVCTFALSKQLVAGTYRWAVRGWNPLGYGPLSNSLTFLR